MVTSEADVMSFLTRYLLPQAPARLFSLPQGDDNENIGIAVGPEKLVLRRYGVTPLSEVAFELRVIAFLVEQNFPTASVLRSREGHLVSLLGGAPAALFRFVNGVHISPNDSNSGLKVARLLGKLHCVTEGASLDGPRSRTDLNHVDRFTELCDSSAVVRRVPGMLKFRSALQTALSSFHQFRTPGNARLPLGLIHHDTHYTNLLVDETESIVALLDFDEAYFGPLVLDVASLIRIWAFETESEIDSRRLVNVLEAYSESRPLSDEEIASLPSAVLLVTAADACDYLLRRFNRDPSSMRPHESEAVARFLRLNASADWLQAIR